LLKCIGAFTLVFYALHVVWASFTTEHAVAFIGIRNDAEHALFFIIKTLLAVFAVGIRFALGLPASLALTFRLDLDAIALFGFASIVVGFAVDAAHRCH